MSIIDWLLLLSIGTFVITFAVTTLISFLRKKKNKKNIDKEKNVNDSDSN